MLILGQGPLSRVDGEAILGATRALATRFSFVTNEWNGFNVLHTAAARVGGMDLGFTPLEGGLNVREMIAAASNGKLKVLYLLGADEVDLSSLGDAFVIYQGHHGDRGAHRADVILPGAAYTEKSGFYVNTEGRVQLGSPATQPPGEAREDWRIIRALSETIGKTLKYDSISELRREMINRVPHFGRLDKIEKVVWENFGEPGNMDANGGKFKSSVQDYYMTDSISRTSEVMAKCSRQFLNPSRMAGTDV